MRIDKPLLMYRYHPQCATHDVDRWAVSLSPLLLACSFSPPFFFNRHTIWNLRVRAIQDFVLNKWEAFTVWNAGKQGRKLFRSLDPHNQAKVNLQFQWYALFTLWRSIGDCFLWRRCKKAGTGSLYSRGEHSKHTVWCSVDLPHTTSVLVLCRPVWRNTLDSLCVYDPLNIVSVQVWGHHAWLGNNTLSTHSEGHGQVAVDWTIHIYHV